MKQLTDLLHILLCDKVHVYDMMSLRDRIKDNCYYYLECDIAEGDTMPDHIEWKEFTSAFKSALEFNDDEEVLDFIRKAVKMSQEFQVLSSSNSHRATFIKNLFTAIY